MLVKLANVGVYLGSSCKRTPRNEALSLGSGTNLGSKRNSGGTIGGVPGAGILDLSAKFLVICPIYAVVGGSDEAEMALAKESAKSDLRPPPNPCCCPTLVGCMSQLSSVLPSQSLQTERQQGLSCSEKTLYAHATKKGLYPECSTGYGD